MKRIVFLILFVAAAAGIYFSRNSKPVEKPEAVAEEAEAKPRVFTKASRSSAEAGPSNPDIAQLKTWLEARQHDSIEGLLLKMSLDLKEHPERLAELLEALKTETDPRLLPMLTRVILEGGAITNQVVAEAALDLAKNETVEARRHAGLFLLGEVPNVTPEMTDAVASISREAKETLVRTSALATMADWMQDHPNMKAKLGGEMLDTIKTADTLEVRANGLLFLGNNLPELPERFTTEMMGFLKDESHFNRAAAAQALAKITQKRGVVVPMIEEALTAEPVLEARRRMLGALVAAAGTGSRDILPRFVNDPEIGQDAKDYLEILGSGVLDPKEIAQKKDRIDAIRHPVMIEKH